MSGVRVYVAMTLALLAELERTRELPAGLPRHTAQAEDEEAEYAALQLAADDSAALLDGPGRRVVVVAELPAEVNEGAPDTGAVVALSQVVAVHADDTDVDPGDPSYADAPELGWWATQEIAELLRLAS